MAFSLLPSPALTADDNEPFILLSVSPPRLDSPCLSSPSSPTLPPALLSQSAFSSWTASFATLDTEGEADPFVFDRERWGGEVRGGGGGGHGESEREVEAEKELGEVKRVLEVGGDAPGKVVRRRIAGGLGRALRRIWGRILGLLGVSRS